MRYFRINAHPSSVLLTPFILFLSAIFAGADMRPNILWIIVDDMSANLSCYGETLIETPHLDKLAEEGVLFENAFVTAPVCSTNRSALITGMYQTSIGSHHHRSGRGELKIELPEGVRPLPELFQEAGYYTAITSWPNKDRSKKGKTDYNFVTSNSMYDDADWSNRKPGQPFFAQIQLRGGKHRGGSLKSARNFADSIEKQFGNKTDLTAVTLPPYYPDDSVLREDWAAYLDTVRLTDHFVGEAVKRLKEEGDFENTVIIFMTDHGISHARGKQFLYDEGIHVPLIIEGPGIEAGQVRKDLVEHIDIAAVSLALAGIDLPATMQAMDFLAPDYEPRTAVFSARDRCDETVDYLRSVRTDRYKYIRNYLYERPHLQPNRYKDGKDIIKTIRQAYADGKLNEVQQMLFVTPRPQEELYDLQDDPYEINNLAYDESYSEILNDMRIRLEQWEEDTGDMGPESQETYDIEMASITKGNKESPRKKILLENIAQMNEWASEGK